MGNTLLFPTSYRFTDNLAVFGLKDVTSLNQFIGNFQATYSPIKNLEINATVGVDNLDSREDRTFPANLRYTGRTNGQRDVYNNNNRQYTYDFNAHYKYTLFDDLNIESVVGSQLFNRKFRSSFAQAQTFATELITDIGAGSVFLDKGENFINTRDAGIFTDHSLNYQGKYFLTVGIRKDYASAIGVDAPSVVYPHVSGAIRLDRLEILPDFFDMFKLRGAYGESGQLPNLTDPIPLLWTATSGGYGGGATISNIGNSKIEPERIKEFEVGIDVEFLKKFSLEFTYYHQSANNSIVGFNNPPSTGLTASSVPFNIGRSSADGFESHLQSALFDDPNFGLDLSLIWNYQTNTVEDLGGAQPIFDGFSNNVIKEGLPKHEFFLPPVLGAKFDANGKYAGVNVGSERVALGNPVPSHTGSFTINIRLLRNINIYALMDWALDRKLFNNTARFAARFGNYVPRNILANKLGLATGSAVDPNITPLTPGTPEYNDAANAYAKTDGNYNANFIEDAKFFKLREISVSYNFSEFLPDLFGSNNYIKELILGFSARNIFTSTPYSNVDVEVNHNGSRSLTYGSDFLTLQSPRTFNFWARISL